jgi:sporulation protein YlmC with PRC-barrel domain
LCRSIGKATTVKKGCINLMQPFFLIQTFCRGLAQLWRVYSSIRGDAMESNSKATLIKLSDTNLTLADSSADVRGRQVLDSSGAGVGEVEDLLIDESERHVRFLQITSGGFLGLGATKLLIPVEAIERLETEHVRINQSREHLANAPQYDPELVEDDLYENLYTHYGYSPYWMGGGIYP